ncbi:hypothetical protein [Massilia sp. TWP1-3-3]|uniref:hypothetical protein n=1 Tax=Massilia sp. TWP1-3-3 TaxID=2804573 RepID=UPI003CFB2509
MTRKPTLHDGEYLAPEDDWDLPVAEQLAAAAERHQSDTARRTGLDAFPAQAPTVQPPSPAQRSATSLVPHARVAQRPSNISTPTADDLFPKAIPVVLPFRDKLDYFPALASRTGLFQAGRFGVERDQATVHSPESYDLAFAGEALTMRDKAIWEACIQIAKGADDAAAEIEVSLLGIGRRIGAHNDGGRALDSIWSSLKRLAGAHVSVTLGSFGRVSGCLLAEARRENGGCWIRLDHVFTARILSEDTQFKMDSARRTALKTLVGQWMHDYLSTHGKTYKDGLDMLYLRSLCGHPCPSRRFPSIMKYALADLALGAPQLVQAFDIQKGTLKGDEWKIHIVRGAEMPVFEQPRRHAPAPTAKKSRRGGVSL